jgi:hypothetical protein
VLITALKELLEAGSTKPLRISEPPADESSRSRADGAAGTDWTGVEVPATVDDYLAMLTAEAAGQQYSKTVHRRVLRQRLSANRTDAAIEYKHQNISAVMIALGLWGARSLPGL